LNLRPPGYERGSPKSHSVSLCVSLQLILYRAKVYVKGSVSYCGSQWLSVSFNHTLFLHFSSYTPLLSSNVCSLTSLSNMSRILTRQSDSKLPSHGRSHWFKSSHRLLYPASTTRERAYLKPICDIVKQVFSVMVCNQTVGQMFGSSLGQ